MDISHLIVGLILITLAAWVSLVELGYWLRERHYRQLMEEIRRARAQEADHAREWANGGTEAQADASSLANGATRSHADEDRFL